MSKNPAKKTVEKEDRAKRLTPLNWISAAAEMLLERGVEEVKVDRLAKKIGVTRGSFYWHFKSRNELMERILAEWGKIHDEFIEGWTSETEGPPEDRLWKLMTLRVTQDEEFRIPEWQAALRIWAKKSEKVAAMYKRQAEELFAAMVGIFSELGFSGDEAMSRAHVVQLFFESDGFFVGRTGASRQERMHYARKFFNLLLTDRPEKAADPIQDDADSAAEATGDPSKVAAVIDAEFAEAD